MGGKSGKLTHQQAKFVEEYLVDLNATQAAIRAGYSAKTAEWIGPKLVTKSHVADAIQAEMEARSKRTLITADRVLAEYAKLAFLDPRKFYDDKGCLIPIHELPDDAAACIAGMDVSTERIGKDADGEPEFATVRKIKLVDKKGALDSVARHLGMFNDKVRNEMVGPGGGPIQHEVICPAASELLAKIIGKPVADLDSNSTQEIE